MSLPCLYDVSKYDYTQSKHPRNLAHGDLPRHLPSDQCSVEGSIIWADFVQVV